RSYQTPRRHHLETRASTSPRASPAQPEERRGPLDSLLRSLLRSLLGIPLATLLATVLVVMATLVGISGSVTRARSIHRVKPRTRPPVPLKMAAILWPAILRLPSLGILPSAGNRLRVKSNVRRGRRGSNNALASGSGKH